MIRRASGQISRLISASCFALCRSEGCRFSTELLDDRRQRLSGGLRPLRGVQTVLAEAGVGDHDLGLRYDKRHRCCSSDMRLSVMVHSG